MPRKSIYDIIAETRLTPDTAFQRIVQRLNREYRTANCGYITPLTAIDRYLFEFIPIKVRRTCFDLDDLLRELNVDINSGYNTTFSPVFNLIELIYCIVANTSDEMALLLSSYKGEFILDDVVECADQIVAETGHEVIDSKRGPIIVTADAIRDLTCEISNEDISVNLLEYTHYSNKGDLKAKSSILQSLYKQNEPTMKLLHRSGDPLIDDLDFIANNIHIRHNNKKDIQMASFAENEIEDWYDFAYKLIIYAILKQNLQTHHKDVKQLRTSRQTRAQQ